MELSDHHSNHNHHDHQSKLNSLKQRQKLSYKTVDNNGKDRIFDHNQIVPNIDNQEFNNGSSSFLGFPSFVTIKAIGLFFKLVSFPFLVFYKCCMLYIDPFGVIRHLFGKVFGFFKNLGLHAIVFSMQKKLVWMLGWGLCWWSYVCVALSCLIVSSLVLSGFVMRHCIEEPIYVKGELNFDYTKGNPVAYLPIGSCDGCGEISGVSSRDNGGYGNGVGLSGGLLPNRKVLVTVLLTLPESDRNRNLGMFQVRVDFLSSSGKELASYSHPCMLQFKSYPIRIFSNFIKIAPLVAGYTTESQTRKVELRSFIEGNYSTSCLRVLIEQRAEFLPNAGFPEIYDTSLIVESELPLYKRIMWYWKNTVFAWISATIFIMELLVFSVIYCIPTLRTKRSNDSLSNGARKQSESSSTKLN